MINQLVKRELEPKQLYSQYRVLCKQIYLDYCCPYWNTAAADTRRQFIALTERIDRIAQTYNELFLITPGAPIFINYMPTLGFIKLEDIGIYQLTATYYFLNGNHLSINTGFYKEFERETY